jgi:choline dehydrogenase
MCMKIQFSSSLLLALALLIPVENIAKCKPCVNPKPYKGNQRTFDYIIVGFGAAGSILARKLSDDFCTSVLVLEAGPNNMEDAATLDPDIFAHFDNLIKISYDPAFAASYPVPVPNSITAIVYSEGREWGGGAAHNYLQAVRGVPTDYNQWGFNSNNPQWFYPNVLPLMKAVETYTPDDTIPNPTQRGFFGPIAITQNPPIDENPFAMAIADVTGAPFISDYNDATLGDIGTAAVQQFITAGDDSRRSFSAYEFMTIGEIIDERGRGLDGRRVRVKGNSVATRILFDGCNNATGVQYLTKRVGNPNEQVRTAYARRKVILCAGSINTPKLLMLSGVGPAQQLQNVGIDVIVDSPHVGQNLQNQYGPSAIVTDGPLPGRQIASFIDMRPYMPADGVRRVQIAGIDVAPGVVQMIGFILQPESRGSIEVVSADPLIPAKVNLNMYSDGSFTDVGSDAYLAVSFYKIVQAIAAAAGEVVLYPSPLQYVLGDESLFAAGLNASALTVSSHIVGTARMGTNISNGVVDGNLNVFGVKNLMIADASVENPITSGNTALGAYVIGLVAAQILGVPTPPAL